MRLKKIKNLIEEQLKILKEQEGCNETLYLIIETSGYIGSFAFTVSQLINYMNTGDSGNYDTNFSASIGDMGFTLNLPNVLGINTEDYGISNKNDLLSIIVSQNDLSIGPIPDIGFGDADSEAYWSALPGNDAELLYNSQVLVYITDCEDSEGEISGCTDPDAINYCPECNVDDGSCNYDAGYCPNGFESMDPSDVYYDNVSGLGMCESADGGINYCSYWQATGELWEEGPMGPYGASLNTGVFGGLNSPALQLEHLENLCPCCPNIEEEHMRWACSAHSICVPNSDGDFATQEECIDSGCGSGICDKCCCEKETGLLTYGQEPECKPGTQIQLTQDGPCKCPPRTEEYDCNKPKKLAQPQKLNEQVKRRLQKLAGMDPGDKATPKKGFGGDGEIPVYLCSGPGEGIEVFITSDMLINGSSLLFDNWLSGAQSTTGFCTSYPWDPIYSNPMMNAAIGCSILSNNNLLTGYTTEAESLSTSGVPVYGSEVYSINPPNTLEDFVNEWCPEEIIPEAECASYPAACCLQQVYGQGIFGTTIEYQGEEVNVPSAAECEGMTLISTDSTPWPHGNNTMYDGVEYTHNPNNTFEQGCCYPLV